jgi:hypothetical protein
MVRYCDDGCIEIDNNAAERALRAIAVGRRNYLFAGSDAGGNRAAAIYYQRENPRQSPFNYPQLCEALVLLAE